MKINDLKKNKQYRRPSYEQGKYIKFTEKTCYCYELISHYQYNKSSGKYDEIKKYQKSICILSWHDIQAIDYELVKIRNNIAEINVKNILG